MAGQQRLGRQTPSERQRLIRLGRQTPFEGARGPVTPVHMIGETPTPSGTRLRPSEFPESTSRSDRTRSTESTKPAYRIEVDDDAETRLYRPRSEPSVAMPPRRHSSVPVARSERPTNRPGIVSRPGALILIPADVPSVRLRADSNVDLIVTHPSGFADAGQEPRRRSLVATLLVVAIATAVLLFVAHEIAITFHLPWLDPKAVLHKLPYWRLLRSKF
jgi:hypothetical protein